MSALEFWKNQPEGDFKTVISLSIHSPFVTNLNVWVAESLLTLTNQKLYLYHQPFLKYDNFKTCCFLCFLSWFRRDRDRCVRVRACVCKEQRGLWEGLVISLSVLNCYSSTQNFGALTPPTVLRTPPHMLYQNVRLDRDLCAMTISKCFK